MTGQTMEGEGIWESGGFDRWRHTKPKAELIRQSARGQRKGPEISKRCQCVTRMPINEFFPLSILNIRQIEFVFFFATETGKTGKFSQMPI